MITLEHPVWLAAAAGALIFAALVRFLPGRDKEAGRRGVSRFERAAQGAALAAAALALGGPVLRWQTRQAAVVFVWDRSESAAGPRAGEGLTPAEEADWLMIRQLRSALPSGVPAALADFAGEPRLLRAFGGEPFEERLAPGSAAKGPPAADRTDIGRALAFAAGLRPRNAELRVVLVSDGWDTTTADGNPKAGVLAGRVWAVPAATPDMPEVIARELEAPARVFEGEPARMRLRLWSARPGQAEARVYANDLLVARRAVMLEPGENALEFDGLKMPPGLAVWSAEIVPETGGDTWPQNNRVMTGTKTRPAARILLLDPDPASLEPAARLFRAAGFDPVAGGPERLPRSAGDLAMFEAVVLSDFPAGPLEGAPAESLREWVAGAGGLLLVCGGAGAFAAGGYAGSQFEEMLPVRSGRPDRLEQSVVAVLVSLDRSGSMQAVAGGRPKMELAAKGAAMAMEVLGKRDFFGVHAVDTRVHEILPLSAGFDRAAARAKILGITSSGGGIYVFTALAEAGRELEAAQARVRHLILFADAADAEEKTAGSEADGAASGGSALDLAAGLASRGVTVSVVALGSADDRDAAFLADLASRGGGKFYLTGNALDLPRIFTAETARIARKDFTEDPFLPVEAAPEPELLRGIPWETAPFLFGANLAEPQPGSEVLLMTEEGTPLLAHHRLGLGRVAVFTSDIKARWAQEWLRWPGFQMMLSQLVRGLLPGETPGWFDLRAAAGPGRSGAGRLVLRALDPAGWFLNGLKVVFQIQAENRGMAAVEAAQTGPGLYSAALPEGAGGLSVVTAVASETGRALASLVLGGKPSPEHAQAGVNEPGLRAVAEASGGGLVKRPAADGPLLEALAREIGAAGEVSARLELAPLLLAAAAAALVVKLAVRRMAGSS